MNHELRELFHELVGLTPREREKVFRTREISAELRAEVVSLLSYESESFDDLTGVVAAAAGEWLRNAEGGDPSHCGPYRLLKPIGAGGMGVVYLAERADGEIHQTVAVKLLRQFQRQEWHDRFLRERQLLASLQHPSIVHVVDAGHTTDGRPYLVMEYVDGVPIDVYTAGIRVEQRLRLFLKVCEGVSHAHRRLIIHRDLKPSNILVTPAGSPKLLDFGIARLVDETGEATQTIERLLTPNYASPEQFAGEAQTTATDVYSLGAVLYKLLTGVAPPRNHQTGEAAALAAPSRINPEVPKDLDFVLRKALRTEPEERYSSVDEMAGDIRAVLAWRPVQARSGDIWYRTRRFLRRYWVPVAATAAVVASLSAGVYFANRERAIAERRFQDVRQLAGKLLDVDVEVAQLAGGAKARQLIVDMALEYLRRVSVDARMDPELSLEVATAYMRVARVQGVSISANLGQTDKSEQNERKAEELIQAVLAARPQSRVAILRSAQIAHDRMILAGDGGRDEEALQLARRSAGALKRYLGLARAGALPERLEAQQAIITGINVANRYRLAGQQDEALQLCASTIDFAKATNWPSQTGATLMIVALIHRERGELDQALQAIRESVRILDPGTQEKRPGRLLTLSLALVREGQILGEADAISLDRPREAEASLTRAFTIADEFARRDPKDFLSGHRAYFAEARLADIVRHSDPRRALGLYNDALKRLEGTTENAGWRRNMASTLAASVFPLLELGQNAEARQRLDAAFGQLSTLKQYPAETIELGSEAVQGLQARAEYESRTGNARRGAEIYQELLERVMASRPKPASNLPEAVEMSNLYRSAARIHRLAGQAGKASALDAERQALWQSWLVRLPKNAFVMRQLEAAKAGR
ncbi:serine/threonine-protein kinase [Paludibaculum fermentans]|uniref:Serine/threonine protein kinase n=1 Tax=Paludibaculum fermentans TaxID=1473598 RepID=A0A7S7NVN9_PALFE|nr:serine/threonine-protein kinase [Paludibaculum fermentans]QOY90677.1 serine/threonine protein kinase [Paludibaculum fermentans]